MKEREFTIQVFDSFSEMDEANRQRLLNMTGVERIRLLTAITDNGNVQSTPKSERTYRFITVPLPGTAENS